MDANLNLPNVPTDNLYKTLAITGVIIHVLSYVALEYRVFRQDELNSAVVVGREVIDDYLSRLQSVTSGLEINESMTEAVLAGDFLSQTEVDDLNAGLDSIEARVDNLREEGTAIREQILRVREMSEAAENYFQRTKRLIGMLVFGFYFGLLLTGVGFFAWYVLLQRHRPHC